jgi:hypothetical protein
MVSLYSSARSAALIKPPGAAVSATHPGHSPGHRSVWAEVPTLRRRCQPARMPAKATLGRQNGECRIQKGGAKPAKGRLWRYSAHRAGGSMHPLTRGLPGTLIVPPRKSRRKVV